ncbi:hypothetical protein FKM82_028004 [Ascaphus truei]
MIIDKFDRLSDISNRAGTCIPKWKPYPNSLSPAAFKEVTARFKHSEYCRYQLHYVAEPGKKEMCYKERNSLSLVAGRFRNLTMASCRTLTLTCTTAGAHTLCVTADANTLCATADANTLCVTADANTLCAAADANTATE